MKMVVALNHSQRYGLGPGEISCYTCHRGSTRPQQLPALPLVASGSAGQALNFSAPAAPSSRPLRLRQPDLTAKGAKHFTKAAEAFGRRKEGLAEV